MQWVDEGYTSTKKESTIRRDGLIGNLNITARNYKEDRS